MLIVLYFTIIVLLYCLYSAFSQNSIKRLCKSCTC